MTDDAIARVRYFDHQYLRRQDFDDEQAYHVAMRRRHLIAGHTWGIVSGLNLVAEQQQVLVEPGYAVDGYGREVILDQRTPVATPAGAASFDVWIRYDRVGSDQAPDLAGICGTTAGEYYRWQEVARLEAVEATDPPRPDQPPGVPQPDLAFPPQRTPPEEDHPWPVFLGRVSFDPNAPGAPPDLDLSARPYAGLVGATIRAPSGGASLRLGPGPGSDQAGAFAVLGAEPDTAAAAEPDTAAAAEPDTAAAAEPDAQPGSQGAKALLQITQQGDAILAGDLEVHGELAVDAAVTFATVSNPTEPQPWSVYRAFTGGVEQLRVELPAPDASKAEDPGGSFVVGAWSTQKNAFVPALTVTAGGDVTVAGTLRVEGTIEHHPTRADGGPARIDTGLDPDASRLITAAVFAGITGAQGLANQLVAGPREAAREGAAAVDQALSRGLASVLAETLSADPGLVEALAAELLARHEPLARALRERLATPEEG